MSDESAEPIESAALAKSKFHDGELVKIRDDDIVGVVIQFGIGLADKTPERLLVAIPTTGEHREVFATACEPHTPESPAAVNAKIDSFINSVGPRDEIKELDDAKLIVEETEAEDEADQSEESTIYAA